MTQSVPVKTAGQVLLYKPEANISPQDIQRLRDAGFIPLCVTDYADVKMMDIAGGAIPFQDILVAAMTSLSGNNSVADNRHTFVQRLAARLTEMCYKQKD